MRVCVDRVESDHREVGIHQVTRGRDFSSPQPSKTCHPDSQNAEYLDSNLLWPDCQFSKHHDSNVAFYDDQIQSFLRDKGRTFFFTTFAEI